MCLLWRLEVGGEEAKFGWGGGCFVVAVKRSWEIDENGRQSRRVKVTRIRSESSKEQESDRVYESRRRAFV